jgi:hypothetical protein
MKSALFAGVAATLLATAWPLIAAPPAPSHDIAFAEVKAWADKAWDRMDVNHDGRIDGADRDVRLLEHFAKWDTNHDGVISKDEFLAVAHQREAGWHSDHRGGPDGAPPPPPPPPGPDGWHHGGHPGGVVMMAIIGPSLHDARKDGVVTRAPFDAAIKAHFDALDTNHDGTLTHDELRAGLHGWHPHPHDHGAMPPPPPGSGQ